MKCGIDADEPIVCNLAAFPAEILKKIFVCIGDVGLLNVANTCKRFTDIAQAVMAKRYAGRYFVIDGERKGGDCEMYAAQFDRFGPCFKAIRMNHVKNIHSMHWLIKILQPRIHHIGQLAFDECNFKSNDFLSQPLPHITHLAFRNVTFGSSCEGKFDLPECGALEELEIHETFCFTNKSLHQMIRVNPGLQRLRLNLSGNVILYADWFEIITAIGSHLHKIKQLTLIDYVFTEWRHIEAGAIDRIANSLKHLESLSLSVADNMFELIQRLATVCTSLKHLGFIGYDDELGNEMVRAFGHIESLCVTYDPALAEIGSPLEHLPHLGHLGVDIVHVYDEYTQNIFANLLPLLRKCVSLRRITTIFKYGCDIWIEDFINANLFADFIEIIELTQKSNACIEVQEYGRIIATITIDGIVWNNMRMHWTNCDKNDTNIHLLDLAKRPVTSNNAENHSDQFNLFGVICDYLDIDTLNALARTCNAGKNLIEKYAAKHSNEAGTFTITNEFHSFVDFADFDDPDDFTHAETFWTPYVTRLNVHIHRGDDKDEIAKIIGSFPFLEKLTIYDKDPTERWPMVLSDLSHIVYDSSDCMNHSELANVIESFPNTEIIELTNAGRFDDHKPSNRSTTQSIGNLKKVSFNFRGETQMNNLKEIFKNTLTQLVPISGNSV